MLPQLRRLLAAPVFPGDDARTRQAYLVNAGILVTVAAAGGMLVTGLVSGTAPAPLAAVHLVTLVVLLGLRQLMGRGAVLLAGYGLVMGASLLGWTTMAAAGTVRVPVTSACVIIILAAGLVLGPRALPGIIVVQAAAVGMLSLAEQNGLLPAPQPYSVAGTWLTYAGIFTVAGVSTYLALEHISAALQRAWEELEARRTAERAWDRTEERYRLMTHNLPNSAVLIFDHDMRFVLADGPEVERHGFSREAFEGRTLFEAIPAEFARLVEPNMRAVLAGQSFRDTLPFGEDSYLYTYIPLYNSAGTVEYGLILAQNVTDQKRIEHALRQSEQRLKTIISNIPVILFGLDHKGVFTLSEGRGLERTGFQAGEVVGRSVFEVYQAYPHVLPIIRQALDGRVTRAQHDLDGVIYDVFYTMVSENHQPELVGVAIEITDQVRTEAALRESEARYAALVNQAYDGVLIVRDGRIQFANPALANLLGYAPAELEQRDFAEFLTADSLELVRTRLAASLEGSGGTGLVEARLHHRHGTPIPVELSAGTVAWRGTTATMGIVRDTTARTQAAAEREALIRELEARNTELERFTYTVSHDLKGPLITIRGFLGYIAQDAHSGNFERLTRDLERIKHAAGTMEHLLDDLLDLSRIGRTMNPADVVALEAVVHDALALLEGRLQSTGIDVVVAPELPTVYGDRSRLVEVFQNLIDNAIKFMGTQPVPVIEIGVRAAHEPPAIFVRDNGIGIAPEYHARVFGLFNKLDSRSEGTGIGLALVRRIIEVHGGTIWIESQGAGSGTTVLFTLPPPPAAGHQEAIHAS